MLFLIKTIETECFHSLENLKEKDKQKTLRGGVVKN